MIRSYLNKTKPEIWLVAGTHYYTWCAFLITMTILPPIVLVKDGLAIMSRGWYAVAMVIVYSLLGFVTLLYVTWKILFMVRYDIQNNKFLTVVIREVRFIGWFCIAMVVLLGIGVILWWIIKNIKGLG